MFQFEGSGFIEFLNVPRGTLSHPTWQEDLVPSPAHRISDKYACLIQKWRDSFLSWSKCAVICDTEDFPANAAAGAEVREGGCAYAHLLWSVLQLRPTAARKAHSAEGIVKPRGQSWQAILPSPLGYLQTAEISLYLHPWLCLQAKLRTSICFRRKSATFWPQTVYSNAVRWKPQCCYFQAAQCLKRSDPPQWGENRPPVKLIPIPPCQTVSQ